MNTRFNKMLLGICFGLWTASALATDTSGEQLAQEAGRSLVGTVAPRLLVKTIDGATIDLGQLYGKQAVYLKFWATWCVPCRQQMPHFEHTYETAGPDLAVIAINTGFNDSVEEVLKYRQKLGITMPIVLDDGEVGAAFHLRVTPQHIVIGRDGRIQYVGHLADATLDAALLAARTGPSSTKSGAVGPGLLRQPIRRYESGEAIPAQRVFTIDGNQFPLRDPAGRRPTVLVFLSPWCESNLETTRPALSADCRKMREQIQALHGESGVRWIGIASGLWATTDDLLVYRKKYNVRIPLTLDGSGDRFRAFNVTQVPTAVLVDSTGRLDRRLAHKDLESPVALQTAMEAL